MWSKQSDFPIIRITIKFAEQSDIDSQNFNIYLNLCQFLMDVFH